MLIRHSVVTNPSATDALSLSAGLADCGTDVQMRWLVRPMGAGDIGAGVGKVQHANGCVMAQFAASVRIRDVLMIPITASIGNRTNQVWNRWYNDTYPLATGLTRPYQVSWRVSSDGRSLSVKDATSTSTDIGPHQVAANDVLKCLVFLEST